MDITIILGAGASRAFKMCPYPLLSEMLEKMFQFAERIPDEIEIKDDLECYLPKQRLFLTYAIVRALNQPYQRFEVGSIDNNEIARHFDNVSKFVYQDRYTLDTIFDLLAKQEADNYESITKAHWALTHAISFFMLQMFSLKHSQQQFDRAHIILNSLIEDLLRSKYAVNVIDFNYDCLLERIRNDYGGSSQATFGWDVGRPRQVLADEFGIKALSDFVKAGKFREPLDGENFTLRANLIKPHGDMCTFLLGKTGIYYRGGSRHSQSTSALFPPKLADVTEDDDFLRASVMPPSNSRRRHSSVFFNEELSRFKRALENSSTYIIIGWSAKGSDKYYDDIFYEIFQDSDREVTGYIIDKIDTSERVKELFCDRSQIKSLQVDGFTGESMSELRKKLKIELAIR